MQRFNVLTGELDHQSTQEGYRWRGARAVGERLGAERIGASVFELEDGQLSFPYHFHHGVEEWLYVIAGTPSVRTPAGERALQAGDLVCFPAGAEGAHTVSGPGRVMMLSANRVPSISVYPESGKLGTRPADERDRLNFRRGDAVGYWDEGRTTSFLASSGRTSSFLASSGRTSSFLASSPAANSRAGPTTGRPVINALSVDVEGDAEDPPGYRPRAARIGPRLEAEMLGATVYELDPGESICPYHYEGGNEEWLLVLTGRPLLRHPGGEDILEPGDMVCFPDGPEGAHRLTGTEPETVRLIFLSTMHEPTTSVYPDSGKIGVWPPGKLFRLADAVGYWDGEL
jgi:uncharacterized cupin superfamily protein